jgi:hypothetical protein
MKAIVVFNNGGPVRHPLGWLLKRGFRHCFVCIVTGNWWLEINGALGVPIIKPLTDAGYDLAAFYRDQGFTVLETEQRERPSLSPFVWNNCVGMVKTVLCLKTWALTPHQLYRFLKG